MSSSLRSVANNKTDVAEVFRRFRMYHNGPRQRCYPPELKQMAVNLIQSSELSPREISAGCKIGAVTLWKWQGESKKQAVAQKVRKLAVVQDETEAVLPSAKPRRIEVILPSGVRIILERDMFNATVIRALEEGVSC